MSRIISVDAVLCGNILFVGILLLGLTMPIVDDWQESWCAYNLFGVTNVEFVGDSDHVHAVAVSTRTPVYDNANLWELDHSHPAVDGRHTHEGPWADTSHDHNDDIPDTHSHADPPPNPFNHSPWDGRHFHEGTGAETGHTHPAFGVRHSHEVIAHPSHPHAVRQDYFNSDEPLSGVLDNQKAGFIMVQTASTKPIRILPILAENDTVLGTPGTDCTARWGDLEAWQLVPWAMVLGQILATFALAVPVWVSRS